MSCQKVLLGTYFYVISVLPTWVSARLVQNDAPWPIKSLVRNEPQGFFPGFSAIRTLSRALPLSRLHHCTHEARTMSTEVDHTPSTAGTFCRKFRKLSRKTPKMTKFAQPGLSRRQVAAIPSERVQIWVSLFLYRWSRPGREATNLGAFDMCHFARLKRGCAIRMGLELADDLGIPRGHG